MDFVPLKLTSTQSGNALQVESFRRPPLQQLTRRRSMSIIAATGKHALQFPDTKAIALAVASATLAFAGPGLTPPDSVAMVEGVDSLQSKNEMARSVSMTLRQQDAFI